LVRGVRIAADVELIVVDNGSTDSAAQEVAGEIVVSEPRRGYRLACAAGVALVIDSDILVFMDGDYSFAPSDIPSLITPIIEDRADMVMGSRVLSSIEPGTMFPQQRFGNWLVSRLTNVICGLSITDLGPYREICRSLLVGLHM